MMPRQADMWTLNRLGKMFGTYAALRFRSKYETVILYYG